jgi:hypothetical protein
MGRRVLERTLFSFHPWQSLIMHAADHTMLYYYYCTVLCGVVDKFVINFSSTR